jgi:hypothetical protein
VKFILLFFLLSRHFAHAAACPSNLVNRVTFSLVQASLVHGHSSAALMHLIAILFCPNFNICKRKYFNSFLYTFPFVKQNLNISEDRCEELNLKGEILDRDHSEPLEEILKRIQFNKIDLEATSLNNEVFFSDKSFFTLFFMLLTRI